MKPIKLTATEVNKLLAEWEKTNRPAFKKIIEARNKAAKKITERIFSDVEKELQRFLEAAKKKPLKNTRGI